MGRCGCGSDYGLKGKMESTRDETQGKRHERAIRVALVCAFIVLLSFICWRISRRDSEHAHVYSKPRASGSGDYGLLILPASDPVRFNSCFHTYIPPTYCERAGQAREGADFPFSLFFLPRNIWRTGPVERYKPHAKSHFIKSKGTPRHHRGQVA